MVSPVVGLQSTATSSALRRNLLSKTRERLKSLLNFIWYSYWCKRFVSTTASIMISSCDLKLPTGRLQQLLLSTGTNVVASRSLEPHHWSSFCCWTVAPLANGVSAIATAVSAEVMPLGVRRPTDVLGRQLWPCRRENHRVHQLSSSLEILNIATVDGISNTNLKKKIHAWINRHGKYAVLVNCLMDEKLCSLSIDKPQTTKIFYFFS